MGWGEISAVMPVVLMGAGLGLFGGLFGIGGGIAAIPVLVLLMGLDQATAQGTALVMMVPNLLIAWWRYVRLNPGGLAGAAGVALAGTATTLVTAQAAQFLDQVTLRALFALFLAFLAVRMIRRPRAEGDGVRRPPLALRWLPLVGLAGGASMGLLGVGGGLVAAPLFTGLFGLGQRRAQSLSLALVTPSSVVALLTYAGNGRVDWPVGGALAVGGLFTVAAGVALAHAWPERLLGRLFGWMLAATAICLVVVPRLH